jgi:broad specificity phosphatase PhoE
MRKLILVKHAAPEKLPDVPSHEWPLSAEGRRKSRLLADRLAGHAPAVVVSSVEPKAAETGRVVADALAVPFRTAPGLEEHDRADVPLMATREFISYMELVFRKPDELVLGGETADQALTRFAAAVDTALAAEADRDVAVVTHGTVLALYAGRKAGLDPFQLWRRLGLPSFMVFELPAWRVEETCESVER